MREDECRRKATSPQAPGKRAGKNKTLQRRIAIRRCNVLDGQERENTRDIECRTRGGAVRQVFSTLRKLRIRKSSRIAIRMKKGCPKRVRQPLRCDTGNDETVHPRGTRVSALFRRNRPTTPRSARCGTTPHPPRATASHRYAPPRPSPRPACRRPAPTARTRPIRRPDGPAGR